MASTATNDVNATPTTVESRDPFAAQREPDTNPFQEQDQDKLADISGSDEMRLSSSPPSKDRRMSKEWDASKVPPSRFQRREGSIYATPNSRDSHVKGSSRDKAYFDKLKEKGWIPSSK